MLWFAVIGLVILALVRWSESAPGDRTILVTEANLATYLQYRKRLFDGADDRFTLSKLSAEERSRLIEDYVREEVLVREARRLGLDQNDYVIRQRLLQKTEFLLSAQVHGELSAEEVDRYWQEYSADYRRPAEWTFRHIYFRSLPTQAPSQVTALLAELNQKSADTGGALKMGDRFAYFQTYERANEALIVEHFGRDFFEHLGALDLPLGEWVGPWQSRHGQHLVLVDALSPGGIPELAAVRESVIADALRSKKGALEQAGVKALTNDYVVQIEPMLLE